MCSSDLFTLVKASYAYLITLQRLSVYPKITMARRNGRRNGRANGSMTTVFKDTVVANLTLTARNNVVEFYSAGLLPGLGTGAATSRTIVPRRCIVEFLPQVGASQDQVFVQVQCGDMFMPSDEQFAGSCFATQPTKLLSQVNPTRLTFDWRKAGTVCPSILKPIRPLFQSTVDRSYLRILASTAEADPNIVIALRITTFVDIFPQDEIVFLDPVTQMVDGSTAVTRYGGLPPWESPPLGTPGKSSMRQKS